jgi:hypothetical protein
MHINKSFLLKASLLWEVYFTQLEGARLHMEKKNRSRFRIVESRLAFQRTFPLRSLQVSSGSHRESCRLHQKYARADLQCNTSTEDGFDGAIKEDVAERNGTQEDPEEGTKQVHVSIVRLRQQEEFVYNLQRLIHCCDPECPELERPQAVHYHETKYRSDTQGDKVT